MQSVLILTTQNILGIGYYCRFVDGGGRVWLEAIQWVHFHSSPEKCLIPMCMDIIPIVLFKAILHSLHIPFFWEKGIDLRNISNNICTPKSAWLFVHYKEQTCQQNNWVYDPCQNLSLLVNWFIMGMPISLLWYWFIADIAILSLVIKSKV